VDRKYYLKSLRTPLINMFLPIVSQKHDVEGKKDSNEWYAAEAAKETETLLFDVTKRRAWKTNAALRSASIANSPLALAFARAAPPKRAAVDSAEARGGGGENKKPRV
jgi:hypothetical protein